MKRILISLFACFALVACDNDTKLVLPNWEIDSTMTEADLEGSYWSYIHKEDYLYLIESGECVRGRTVGGAYKRLILFENGQMVIYAYTPRVVQSTPKHAVLIKSVPLSFDANNRRITNPTCYASTANILQLTKDQIKIETSPATIVNESTYKMSFVQLTRTTLSDEVLELIENATPIKYYPE